MNLRYFIVSVLLPGVLFVFQCAMDPIAGGGGSDVGNGVVGKIMTSNGKSPVNARVLFIPSDYDPEINDFGSEVLADTVDSNGNYQFSVPKQGTYNIQAFFSNDGSRLLIEGIRPTKDSVTVVSTDTLRKPGALKVMLPDSFDPVNDHVYVPGTTIGALLSGNGGSIVLDSVPAGTLPVLYYSAKNNATLKPIRYNILIASGLTTVINNPGWCHARRLFLNTCASGAGIAGNVLNFPVLIRLTKNNFNFSEAQSNGNDIRFAKQDNTVLSYEIERWDPVAGVAEAWVKVDTVFGNDSAQCITMYWGNPQVISASNGAAVFDTGNGFQGVWHMNQAAGAPVRDATYNNYVGTRYGQTPLAPWREK